MNYTLLDVNIQAESVHIKYIYLFGFLFFHRDEVRKLTLENVL